VPIVLTCRSDEDTGPALIAWLGGLQRNRRVERLDLPPLSEAETSEQIALMLGRPPPPALSREIFPCSEGNAFFTEQLLAAGERGGAGLSPSCWPACEPSCTPGWPTSWPRQTTRPSAPRSPNTSPRPTKLSRNVQACCTPTEAI
jgi:hypothetical protein